MLDEGEGLAIGILGAGQERLPPGLGSRIGDRACEVGFEDVAGDRTPATSCAAGFPGEPALQLARESDGQDR